MISSRRKILLDLAKKTSTNIQNSTATEENVNINNIDDLNSIDINAIDTFVFSDDNNIVIANNEDAVVDDNQNYTINNDNNISDSISFDEYVSPRAVECSSSDNVDQIEADDSDSDHNNNIFIVDSVLNVEEHDDYGVKKRKIAARLNKKTCIMYGESYKKLKKDKSIVTVDKKIIKENPCLGKKCTNECNTITEEERLIIFNRYWKDFDHTRKRDYLLCCMVRYDAKRQYVTHESNRFNMYKYSLSINDTTKVVCRKYLLNTLNITEKLLRFTRDNKVDLGLSKIDDRGKKSAYNKTSEEVIKIVHTFINKLPAVPSHYCRSSSTKKYIGSEFQSLAHVYRIYVEDCKLNNNLTVSSAIFQKVWRDQYNIGIHVPKKDKCTHCEAYNNRENLTEDENMIQENHLKEKQYTYDVFKSDQERSGKDGFLCCSFDLQKVLNTPAGNSMLLYYSRKLAYYNLSVYESNSKAGFCYLWSEVDGLRGSNEISSIIFSYLKSVDERSPIIQDIAFYCDSCPGQNKNHKMISMLHYFLVRCSTNIKTITINYLLPGHTYMPVDSIHACIEKNIKKKIIWAPSEWPTVIRNSRINAGPYTTIVLSHIDFLDWTEVCNSIFNKPKIKDTNDCQVKFKTIRSIILIKDNPNKIQFSYSFENLNYNIIDLEANKRLRSSDLTLLANPKQLYTNKLPLNLVKYKDLSNLCTKNVIPKCYQQEYLNLPYKSAIRDSLPETDEDE